MKAQSKKENSIQQDKKACNSKSNNSQSNNHPKNDEKTEKRKVTNNKPTSGLNRDLSKEEQEEFIKELSYALTEAVNKVRLNPKYLIPFLEKRLECFKDDFVYVPPNDHKSRLIDSKIRNTIINNAFGPILFIEGKKAVEEAIEYLKEVKPLYELTHNNYLFKTATEHAIDMGINGLISHEGSDGKSLIDRVEKICDWNGMLSENLEFGSLTPEDILCTWIIDDGVSLRTHRSNLFSDRYKYYGVSVCSHLTEGVVTVIDLAEELYGFNEVNPNIIEKTFYLYPSNTDEGKFINTYLEVDPEAPENTVNVYKSVIIKNVNGKTSQKQRKIYTLDDGSKIEM